jgi:HK97 family phage major capsid protein
MSFLEIKSAIDRQAEAFEAFKDTNDQRFRALEKGDKSGAAELAVKLERINEDVTKFSKLKEQLEKEHEFQKERIEMLEARASNPVKTAEDKLKDEYKSTFEGWIRARGQDSVLESKMQELGRKAPAQQKSVTIGSTSGGGYAVPEEIARDIERMELLFSPVRSLVKVVQVGTDDYKELVSLRGASSGWVSESGSRTETDTPILREVTPTRGELYAYPKASEWSLDDIFFNVEAWLAEEVAQEFAYQEGTAVISGDGSSKPTGMLNTTPVLTDDFASPLRAAAAFQYIASDSDAAEGSPATPNVTGDALIDTVMALNAAYRNGAQWIMNSATQGAIRKMKDSNGQYLWQPSLQAGQPNMLLGYSVATWEQMPDVGLNNFPVGFGNWRRAYVLVDRVGLRITRDQYTSPGFVKFYIRRREGGIVLNNDAAKFVRTIS